MPARRQGPGRASRLPSTVTARPRPPAPSTSRGRKPGTDDVKELQRQAIRWTHVVRNRARWIGTPSLAKQQDENAREFLAFLGINDAQREQLALAGNIRVSVPYTEEQHGWEARILPWEFLLSAGTRDLRTGSLVVTRSLLQQPATAPAVPPTARSSSSRAPRAPGAGLGLQGRTTSRQAVRGEGRRAVPATRLPHSRAARGGDQEVPPRHRPPRRLRHAPGARAAREPRAEDAPDGYLLAGAGGVEPVAALDLAAALSRRTASLPRSCSATSGTPRRGSPR